MCEAPAQKCIIMIIYLFQDLLWLLLSQGAAGTSQRSMKRSFALLC
jgi:hypothetical protein